MMPLPGRPCLALPFTLLAGPGTVHLVAGEEFRFTLSAPGLDAWLPGWLPLADGSRPLDELLLLAPTEHWDTARGVLERLHSERMLTDGPIESFSPRCAHRLDLCGRGPIRSALEGLPRDTDTAPPLRVLCQDRLDLDEVLRFNDACLGGTGPWLWTSTGAMSRGYVSPVILPDAGPCLACLLGHFRRLSPLPWLHDELIQHRQAGGEIQPVPFPASGTMILAHLVAWKVELLGRAEPPGCLFRLHVLETRTLATTAHSVFLDPECPACRGRR